MSISDELQSIVSDITRAIIDRKSFGRVELERLRNQLAGVREDVSQALTDRSSKLMLLEQLCDDIDRGTADLVGAARRTRARLPEAAQ